MGFWSLEDSKAAENATKTCNLVHSLDHDAALMTKNEWIN